MKKIISIAASLSVGITLTMADNAVLSKDNLGDFLLAPLYLAKGNICTKVSVYNTNMNHSILAKVAFREQLTSNEVDLPIFLTPGDVWSGMVCQRDNGDVYLTSKDNSNHPAIKPTLLTGKNLTAQSKAAGNDVVDFRMGYIEVYPIAEFKDKHNVTKSTLVKRWDNLIKGQQSSKLVVSGVDGYSLTANVRFVDKKDLNKENSYTTMLPMVAFKGTHDKTLLGSAIGYGNDTAPDVLLGTTKKYQILKLLKHHSVMFNYVNSGKDQYVVFTYPFGYAKDQIRKYKVVVMDMEGKMDKKPKEEIIFSPKPQIVPNNLFMKNEVATISVADIISKTTNPSHFKAGQIQITDITNVNDVQLGAGKNASFVATYLTLTTDANGSKVENARYIPSK